MAKSLDIERFRALCDKVADNIIPQGEEVVKKLDDSMALEFDEWYQFQNMQTLAFASGRITAEVAQAIYRHLNGEVMNGSNGGWSDETDTAEKVVITQLMSELIGLKIAGRLAVAS
jgi:hypothetical protein